MAFRGGRGPSSRGGRAGSPQIGHNYYNSISGGEESTSDNNNRGGHINNNSRGSHSSPRGGRGNSMRGGRVGYPHRGRGSVGAQRGGNAGNFRQDAPPSSVRSGEFRASPTPESPQGQASRRHALPRRGEAETPPTTILTSHVSSSSVVPSRPAENVIVADAGSIYLNNNICPPGLKVYVDLALPSEKIPKLQLDLDDPVIQKRLDGIRSGCQVWIRKHMAEKNYLILEAQSKANIKKAVAEIQNLIHHPQEIWKPFYLVQPAVDGDEDFGVRLNRTNKDCALLVFIKYEKPEPPKENAGYSLHYEFTKKFRETFNDMAQLMMKAPSEMTMRAHLGQLGFSQWRKRSEDMTYQEFLKFHGQAGHRGCLSFDTRLGDEEFAHQALAKVFSSPHIFEPASPTAAKLDDTMPRKFLILFIKGYRVEVEIQDSDPPRLSSTRVFEQTAPPRNLEISVVCPGRSYDWKLEVLRETGLTELRLGDIKDHIRLLDPIGVDKFPRLSLSETAIRMADIERIETKTVWTVIFGRSGHYFLDICLDRQFPDLKRLNEPVKSCSLVMYGSGWDDETRTRHNASSPRDFGCEHCRLMPTEGLDCGYMSFLAAVETLQRLFTEDGRGSVPGGKRLPQLPSSGDNEESGQGVAPDIGQESASGIEEKVDALVIAEAATEDAIVATTTEDAAGFAPEAEDLISFELPQPGSSYKAMDDADFPDSLI